MYDLCESLTWVFVGDASLAFDDAEVNDFPFIVEDGLCNCDVVVSATELDAYVFPLC